MKMIHQIIACAVLLILVQCGTTLVAAQRMNAEILVKNHLEAIGSAENRSALKDMTVSGPVRYNILRAGGVRAEGAVVISSDAMKMLLGMKFNSPNYTGDMVVCDGSKVKIGYTVSNVRSYLGDFLYRSPEVVNRGLFGGALTTGWVLYDPAFRKSRIEYDGVKKLNDRDVYVLSFLPKGGSDVEIKMYFDKATFYHVRTSYKRIISSTQRATVDSSVDGREQRQTLIEDFGGFRNESGLTLPHNYRIYVIYDGQRETMEYEWVATLSDFLFNQKLDPNSFNAN